MNTTVTNKMQQSSPEKTGMTQQNLPSFLLKDSKSDSIRKQNYMSLVDPTLIQENLQEDKQTHNIKLITVC